MSAWMLGRFRWPTLLVAWRGSCPSITVCALMRRNASITTLPFTLCTGSITTLTARPFSCSNEFCVEMSTPDSQQPKPGWEWYLQAQWGGVSGSRQIPVRFTGARHSMADTSSRAHRPWGWRTTAWGSHAADSTSARLWPVLTACSTPCAHTPGRQLAGMLVGYIESACRRLEGS